MWGTCSLDDFNAIELNSLRVLPFLYSENLGFAKGINFRLYDLGLFVGISLIIAVTIGGQAERARAIRGSDVEGEDALLRAF
jgi:hypothetical protein